MAPLAAPQTTTEGRCPTAPRPTPPVPASPGGTRSNDRQYSAEAADGGVVSAAAAAVLSSRCGRAAWGRTAGKHPSAMRRRMAYSGDSGDGADATNAYSRRGGGWGGSGSGGGVGGAGGCGAYSPHGRVLCRCTAVRTCRSSGSSHSMGSTGGNGAAAAEGGAGKSSSSASPNGRRRCCRSAVPGDGSGGGAGKSNAENGSSSSSSSWASRRAAEGVRIFRCGGGSVATRGGGAKAAASHVPLEGRAGCGGGGRADGGASYTRMRKAGADALGSPTSRAAVLASTYAGPKAEDTEGMQREEAPTPSKGQIQHPIKRKRTECLHVAPDSVELCVSVVWYREPLVRVSVAL